MATDPTLHSVVERIRFGVVKQPFTSLCLSLTEWNPMNLSCNRMLNTARGAVAAAIFCLTGAVLAQASASQEASLARALELERQKDFAGAERIYREALRQSSDDPDILKRLGIVCQEQNKHQDTIEILQRILKRAP